MMDRRSQHDFPAKRIDITGFLNHCWTEGWFDEYSNDHFLIKAIEDMNKVYSGHSPHTAFQHKYC